MALKGPSLRRHLLAPLALAALLRVAWIYTIDSPKSAHHCPLHTRDELARRWSDEGCYWSDSYAEAREKFVALGNALRDQVRSAGDGSNLDLVDVRSLSYDVHSEDFPGYLDSLEVVALSSSQTIAPGGDTVDALLLTLRIPEGKVSSATSKAGVDVVISSGTHGVEGYLGSAVQMRFLHELFLENEVRLTDADANAAVPKGTPVEDRLRKVLLIHAVNPYGMRHHRRFNENNVDLNRNALDDKSWADIRQRDPNFVGYVDMDATLNPFPPIDEDGNMFLWAGAATNGGFKGDMTKLRERDREAMDEALWKKDGVPKLSTGPLGETEDVFVDYMEEKKEVAGLIGEFAKTILTRGYTAGKRAMVSSQYHKPSGIFYGGGAHNGNTWENSVFALRHAIYEFAGIKFDSDNERAIWIDIHTGLGKYGEYSVLTKDGGGTLGSGGDGPDDGPGAWRTEFTSILEKSGMGYGKSADAGVSAGYEQTIGFVNDAVLCPPPRCLAVTQEFGTRPGVGVGLAMVLENKGYHSAVRGYGHMTSWAFNPRRVGWRSKTLRGGMDMIYTVLNF